MRRSVVALVAIVLIAGTGCAAGVSSTDVPSGINTADSRVPVQNTDPADVLFRVDPAPSWLVPRIAAFAAPTITVYQDGIVVRQKPNGGPGVPPQFVAGRAEPDLLAAFVAELDTWHRPVDNKAFGVPHVTDLASIRVVVHTPKSTATLDIYGFQQGLDRYVSDAARANRAALRHLIDHAASLIPGGDPYVPAAVRVVDVGPIGQNADAPDWPGPSLDHLGSGRYLGFGCLVIDESAADLYRAAVANGSGVWATPTGPRVIAVTPLLPGQSACL